VFSCMSLSVVQISKELR